MNNPSFFVTLIISVLTSVVAENFVFSRAFGIGTMMIAANNRRNLPGICLGVTYFTLAAAAATWLLSRTGIFGIDKPFIAPVYAVIIGLVYLVTLLLAFVFLKGKFGRFKKYVHISAFNGAVMGTIFLSLKSCTTLLEYDMFGISAGIGFTIASYMLSGVYQKLYSNQTPAVFKGYPAVMIFIGIMAMALYGILGHAPSYT